MFEYGHILHKQQKPEESIRILMEAMKYSSDVILNIIGKNHQQTGDYLAAERLVIRSTYRLPWDGFTPIICWQSCMLNRILGSRIKLEEMKQIVLAKAPEDLFNSYRRNA